MTQDSPFPSPLAPAALLDSLPAPLFAVDAGWRLVYVNPPAARLLGGTAGDLPGRLLWDAAPGAVLPGPAEEYRRVMETRRARTFEVHDPGSARWLEVRAWPCGDGLAAQGQDVTERRRREALLESTPTLAAVTTVPGALGAVHDLAARTLGAVDAALWRAGEGRSGLEPWPGTREGTFPDAGEPAAALTLTAGGETLGVLSLRFGPDRTLTGAEHDFARSLAGALAQTLERLGAAAANARTLAGLERERAGLLAILDQLPAAVWVAEVPGGRLVAGNRAIEAVLRQPYRPGASLRDYSRTAGFHPDGRRYEPHEWPLARTILTGERVEGEEIELERGDGTRGFVRFASALVEPGGEDPALAVVTGVDVTELRELSAGLEERVEARTRELVGRMAELAAETAALQAFASFTELSSRETNPAVLTQAAAGVLHRALGEGSTGYYERAGGLWRQTAWDGNMDPATLLAAEAGFPAELPLFADPAGSREPLFVEDWRASDHVLAPHTPEYGAIAVYPVTVQGATVGLLAAGLREKAGWSERDRAVFRAVGRALGLAAERAHLARVLHLQNEALAARGSALEAFAELGRDLTRHLDPLDLVRRALEILLGTLPGGDLVYAEPEGDRWHVRVRVGAGSAGMGAAPDAGLPRGETPTLDRPWETRRPLDHGRDDPGAGGPGGLTAAASLPVLVNGEPRGVVAVALLAGRPWRDTDRMVLETVVRSLGLALERAEGDRALAAKQAELEQANRDLEAFASSASHDLRAPVRHIAGFAGRLRRSVVGDPEAERYVGIIEESAGRMATLIDSLLAFARLGTGEVRRAEVALGDLVAAVRADLPPGPGGRRVEWRVGDLPSVRGDPTLLRQVLQNLLGNALKYSRTRDVAVIEVWAERVGAEHWLHVRDNGVGFDPRHRGQMFEVFRRLHSPRDFEGDGVGLASVQRIAERHGGRVWATGEVDRGATLTLALPA